MHRSRLVAVVAAAQLLLAAGAGAQYLPELGHERIDGVERPAASPQDRDAPTPQRAGADRAARSPTPPEGVWTATRFRKGMAILPYRGDYDEAKLPGMVDRLYDRLAGLGVDAISISVPLYQESHTASEIRRGDRTPSDDDLRLMFRKAQARHWWVTFRPYLDESNWHVENRVWRGTLAPEDRDAWFGSYAKLLLDYARIAQERGVDTFIIGVEYNSLDTDPRWLDVIKTVRGAYSGQVTYAANWDHVGQVPFWDKLDLVGIDSFYPLGVDPDHVTPASIERAWQPWVEQVRAFRQQYGKPVVFLELGVTAQKGGPREPWTWQTGTPVDLEAQRAFYEGTCAAVKPLVQGMYWWVAFLWLEPNDPPHDPGHTPFGKPAEQEIRKCYQSPAAAPGAGGPKLPRRGQQSSPARR